MKRVYTIFTLMALLLTLLLSACGGNSTTDNQPSQPVANNAANQLAEEPAEDEEPAPAIEVVDSLGETLVLTAPAQRIISLAPSITEILFAIGAGDQVVGREDFANYPEEVVALPSIGGTWGELNVEAMLALEPDLILAAPLTTQEQVASMTDVGLNVFLMPNPTTMEGMYDLLRTAAKITGHEEETEDLIADLITRVDAVTAVVAEAETTPVVFYELDGTSDPAAPWTTGPGTFIDTLITMAGGKNVSGDLDGAWVQISAEELISRNPDVIILGDAIWGVTVESVGQRAGWEAIHAVSAGTVYPFNDDLASRPGPRLVDGLEELARLIHPELFE
ncbi:MAG: ABC transporter substrate-binding protein [Anaerolineales bacterium]|nr:ABC transporter substrate-binding protein [Anaerolineales bacterium]